MDMSAVRKTLDDLLLVYETDLGDLKIDWETDTLTIVDKKDMPLAVFKFERAL